MSQRRQALAKILNSEPTEVTAYTDGSAVESNRNCSAGAFTAAGDRLEVARPAGVFTSLFQAELVALYTAQKTCLEKYPQKSLKVINDPLSVVNRMEQLCDSNSPKSHLEKQTRSLIKKYNDRRITPLLIWCPSHVGVDGNQKADKLAEQGSKLEHTAEHPHDTAKKTINRHLKEAPKRRGMDDNLSRKEQVETSRLRSSHHPELRLVTQDRKMRDITVQRMRRRARNV